MTTIHKKIPWNIVRPTTCPSRPQKLIASAKNLDILDELWQQEPLAMDLETRGTQAAYMFLPEEHPSHCFIQQVGLSNGKLAVVFDKRVLSESDWVGLWEWLEGCSYLFGHNVMFDASFSYAECLLQRKEDWHLWNSPPPHAYLKWKSCTYLLYKLLAGEAYPGQQWGLKSAQKELLGWKKTNEEQLDKWLVGAGHYVGSIPKELDTEAGRLAAYATFTSGGSRRLRPNKAEMYRAPPHILGHYCALDAYSTYLLYKEVLMPSMASMFGEELIGRVLEHVDEWMQHIRLHVSQQLSGIYIDREKMTTYQGVLDSEIESKTKEFLAHESVRDHIRLYNESMVTLLEEREPPRYNKLKFPKEIPEPSRLTKAGKPSKAWDKWNERQQLTKDMTKNPSSYLEVSGNWKKWNEKVDRCRETEHFRPSSSKDLEWLFYEWLGHDTIVTTDSGGRATNEKAKLGWKEAGILLIQLDHLQKETAYVRAVLAESAADGIAHVRMKAPGTVTLRLSGGSMKKNKAEPSLNIQQSPKSRPYLECFKARPGRIIVQSDFTALENVVLAEVTRDHNMLKLYGPNSLKTDAYVWNGSQLPVIGKVFRDAGYDPNNPTDEAVAFIKKNHKMERGIAKKVVLGKNYGMGAGKLRADLAIEGIAMTQEEAREIINGLNLLYEAAYVSYPEALKEEWIQNRGFVINSMGLPCSVDHGKIKDLVNRVTQSAGHQITIKSACLLEEELQKKGLTMMWWPGAEGRKEFISPWILDFHDEHMVECDESVKSTVVSCYESRLRRLNEWLGSFIPLEAAPDFGHDLAKFKCE